MTEISLIASVKGDPNCLICQTKIKDRPNGEQWACYDMTLHVPTLCESCRDEPVAIRVNICGKCLSENAKQHMGWVKEVIV